MKTRAIHLLAAALLGATAHPVRAQLDLPWEKEKPKTVPGTEKVEQPGKPADMEGQPATPVLAAYRCYLDEIARQPSGRVLTGTPRISPTEIGLTVNRDGEVSKMVFVEKSNDGRKALVVFGPEASEGVVFTAERNGTGWTARLVPEESAPEMPGSPVPAPDSGQAAHPPAASVTWRDLLQRQLAEADLDGLDPAALRLLRNEVYARRGLRFQSEDLRSHFGAQPWYVPSCDKIEDNELSANELANVRTILAVEKQLQSAPGAVPQSGGAMPDLLALPEAQEFQALLRRKQGAGARLQAREEETPNAEQLSNYGFRFTGVNLGYEDAGLQRFMPWERFAIREDTGEVLHYDVVADAYESLAAWRKRRR